MNKNDDPKDLTKEMTKEPLKEAPRPTAQQRADHRKEARLYRRLSLKSKFNGTLVILEGTHVSGCVVPYRDFSKSGACVYLKKQLAPKKPIKLTIEGCEQAPLEGHIVWCRAIKNDSDAPAGYTFCAGIDFKPRDDEARDNQLDVYRFIKDKLDEAVEGASHPIQK